MGLWGSLDVFEMPWVGLIDPTLWVVPPGRIKENAEAPQHD
jgi:hypothetical protein